MEQVTGDIADEKLLERVITEDVRRCVSIIMEVVTAELGFKGRPIWWCKSLVTWFLRTF